MYNIGVKLSKIKEKEGKSKKGRKRRKRVAKTFGSTSFWYIFFFHLWAYYFCILNTNVIFIKKLYYNFSWFLCELITIFFVIQWYVSEHRKKRQKAKSKTIKRWFCHKYFEKLFKLCHYLHRPGSGIEL